jgi:death-on-curing protein
MKYLSVDEIQAINEVVVEESGGSVGVREPGLLISIAHKPQAGFGDEELYPDIFTKAAVLYEAIVNYHVFVDGNKRTGYATAARFLAINKYELVVTNQELEDYTISIATKNPDINEVAAWLKQHSRKTG